MIYYIKFHLFEHNYQYNSLNLDIGGYFLIIVIEYVTVNISSLYYLFPVFKTWYLTNLNFLKCTDQTIVLMQYTMCTFFVSVCEQLAEKTVRTLQGVSYYIKQIPRYIAFDGI